MCKEKTKWGAGGEQSPCPLLGQFVRTLLKHFFHHGGRRRCNRDVPKMKAFACQIGHWTCGRIMPFLSGTGKEGRYCTVVEIVLETHVGN